MKKAILIATLSLFLFSCNINPSKEARLQKLEAEMQQSMEKITTLEASVQALEKINTQLKARIVVLEK